MDKTRCVCETRMPPQRPFFFPNTMTLVFDLDFGTKERVLPQGIYTGM